MASDLKQWQEYGDLIHIPAGAKGPPPKGSTGALAERVIPKLKFVKEHVAKGGNYAAVIRPEYIVLDVDAHRNHAAARIAEQMLQDYKMPLTLRVSSRFDTHPLSGHYWLKLPKHDWKNVGFRGTLVSYGVEWGEVRHHHLSYVLMPGCTVEDREYEARWEGGEGVIADIPDALYRAILQPHPKPIKPGKGGKYTKKQQKLMLAQARWSLWEFRMAEEGSRDDKHFKACRDIGGLVAVGIDKAKIDEMISRVEKYGHENGADRDTMAKTMGHIEKGSANPRLLDGTVSSDSWWYSRPGLERTYNRALLNLDSPWSTLLSELVILAAATDHRIVLDPWTSDQPTPIALWVGIVAESGSGKSRTFRRARKWAVKDLPMLAKPPRPEPARAGTGIVLPHNDDTLAIARQPVPRVSNPQTGPGLMRCFMGYLGEGRGKREAKTGYRLMAYYDEPNDLFRRAATENNLLSLLRSSFYSEGSDPMIGKVEGQYRLSPLTYSVNLLVSIQPYIMREFRAMERDGTYQRMVFCERGIDVNVAKKMRDHPEDYPYGHVPVEPWHPTARKGTKKKAAGARGIVSMHPSIHEELEAMVYWGEGDADGNYDAAQVTEWLAMCPKGQPEEVLGHLDVRLQRLAAMLARHDGVPLDEGRLEVPYSYFADAKEVMKHSATVVASTIQYDIQAKRVERKAVIKEQVELAVAIDEAKVDAQVKREDPVPWMIERLLKRGGSEGGETFANAARKMPWWENRASLWELVAQVPEIEVTGRPKVLTLKGEADG